MPVDQVNLTKNGRARQPHGEILKVRQKVLVWDQAEVEPPVVSTQPPFTVGLRHQMRGRNPLTPGRANDPKAFQLGELPLGHGEIFR